jgi:hypothetical protein
MPLFQAPVLASRESGPSGKPCIPEHPAEECRQAETLYSLLALRA